METIVSFVVRKLGDMIVKEAELLGGVGEQVKWAQTELTNIQCFLRDADTKGRKGDERAKNWLNQLRDVAYRIEDAVDTFNLDIEDDHKKDPKFWRYFKYLGGRTKKVPDLHKLAKELGDIRKVLEGISKSRIDYGIEPLQDKAREEVVPLPFRKAATLHVGESEVVGLDAARDEILQMLLDEGTPRLAVITIVGIGGLGKTTLARMVYQSAMAHFDIDVVLTISQEFTITDTLIKMICKLKNSKPNNQEVDDLLGELRVLLSGRRYLIILDDVWKVDLWNQLKDALPDDKNRSRVLMTSKDINIANLADPKMPPFFIQYLSERDSLNLFLKKAVPFQKCPDDVLKVAEHLSRKCGGLPLALIVLGGVLSTKQQTYHSWKNVLDRMDWHQEGKDCMKILALSYEDMPCYLKTCFLYLASFPENYEISAKRLIRMWVAEGFLPVEERKTMEETAEACLENLSQRCIVEVSSRAPSGSIKYFRVHDLLRVLAIHEAKEEKFLTVLSEPQLSSHRSIATRRVSLQSCIPKFMDFRDSNQFMKYIGPMTRSMIWFGRNDLVNYSRLKLLRVLEIADVVVSQATDLEGLDSLIHLKYLGLRNCVRLSMPTWSLGQLRNLETLDLRGTSMKSPPTGLWMISTLRHVLYDGLLPLQLSSEADLRNLQTLKWVCIWDSLFRDDLRSLYNLRKLGISNGFNDSEEFEWFVSHNLKVETLPSLIYLGIRSGQPIEMMYLSRTFNNFENLQTLHLEGKWSNWNTLKASIFPPHLVKLTLINSDLDRDPMRELGRLKSLKKLRLEGDVYTDEAYSEQKKMICEAGFPVLQSLVLKVTDLDFFDVSEGVMPQLKYLTTQFGTKLNLPPDLESNLIYNGMSGLASLASSMGLKLIGSCVPNTTLINPH